ncbi:LOW QUALITY PROTEIN: 18 kDa cyclophilin, putative [Eimeria mitis]|uniref:Peptidyl-prolyl cis-trans isomerase n=1 Tax=Eimeria mitis TaxID=44415 RepID=U6KCX0_9EIME|nr:LOW QUALITY PROTEIN: 18 kDa cyclophilin, putative [Eimeria mitis]CDJ35840.1 18 kDa cyclophilin, putative [Eimeria mitis]
MKTAASATNLDLMPWAVTACLRAAADPVKEAYMEIAINGEAIGFLNFKLRPDVVPKTVKNFVDLLPRYTGTSFHRIIPDFMVQGGDVQRNVLPGADTSPVPSFNDENFELKHVGPGILSMANAGPNTNSSQFFVTTVATPWLDNRHVVFGTVTDDSMEVLKRIEATGSSSGRPSAQVTVKSTGVGHKPNSS